MNTDDEDDHDRDVSSSDWVQVQSTLGALFGIATSISLLSIIISGDSGFPTITLLRNRGWLMFPVICIALLGFILSAVALLRYRINRKRSYRNQSYIALQGLIGLLLNGLVLLAAIMLIALLIFLAEGL